MNEDLRSRLNRIYDRITAKDFLDSSGIGNEIAFFVFDYPPNEELGVREFIPILENKIRSTKPDLRLVSINLFRFLIDHLRDLNLLEESFRVQRERGNAALLHAVKGLLNPEELARQIVETARPRDPNLMLIHGVGSVYPLLRTHALLNNLHPVLDRTPLVLFFPGTYVHGELCLFGGTVQATEERRYYRALRLID
ncbi:MAG: DUF1788 domain-containing protein [Rhodothermaceae bacterium]|nr:DUF1788 domain-containing protein [Rhodothermaceae bacterium]